MSLTAIFVSAFKNSNIIQVGVNSEHHLCPCGTNLLGLELLTRLRKFFGELFPEDIGLNESKQSFLRVERLFYTQLQSLLSFLDLCMGTIHYRDGYVLISMFWGIRIMGSNHPRLCYTHLTWAY